MNGWQLKDLIDALGEPPVQMPKDQESWPASDLSSGLSFGFSIDSRSLRRRDMFISIQGEKRDGHQFIPAAIEAGAGAIIARKGYLQDCSASRNASIRHSLQKGNIAFFEVEQPLAALHALAAYHRRRLPSVILAVTGSNGKSSSKEMLGSLLRSIHGHDKVFISEGNFNNHLGLPLSLLQIRESHRFAILEMGMNHRGEISCLSRLATPHHALITSIGQAHTEFFESVEEIAAAKLEILDGMRAGGFLAYHSNSVGQDLARQRAEQAKVELLLFHADEVKSSRAGLHFLWQGEQIELPLIYSEAQASNLSGCLTLLQALGFDKATLAQKAKAISLPLKRRFEVIEKRGPQQRRQLLVDDSYNANPDSFCSAIGSLRRLLPQGRLALFAGEMAELGALSKAGHEAVGRQAAADGYELLGLCGKKDIALAGKAFQRHRPKGQLIQAKGPEELFRLLTESRRPHQPFDGILIKGSRSARMDILSDLLKEQSCL